MSETQPPFKRVFLHWRWGSDEESGIGIVEVKLSEISTKPRWEDDDGTPAFHLPMGELQTLFHQVAGLNMLPTMIGPAGVMEAVNETGEHRTKSSLGARIVTAIIMILAVMGILALVRFIRYGF